MDKLFEKCIDHVLKNEGGYINDPDDPGGETKYGIAKRFYPNLDIKNLTIDKAKEIYYKFYWLPMNLTGIKDENVVLQMFDFGVNAGIRRAVRKAQQVLHVKQDGICGDETKKAINEYPGNFFDSYQQARIYYYRTLTERKSKLNKFYKGWYNRTINTHF